MGFINQLIAGGVHFVNCIICLAMAWAFLKSWGYPSLLHGLFKGISDLEMDDYSGVPAFEETPRFLKETSLTQPSRMVGTSNSGS